MIGCIYKIDGEIKSYPNKDRLLKKYPNVEILQEVEDISQLSNQLIKYLGGQIKERPKHQPEFGTREYYDLHKFYYVGLEKPIKCVMMVHPSEISKYKHLFYTQDYNEYVKWYKRK